MAEKSGTSGIDGASGAAPDNAESATVRDATPGTRNPTLNVAAVKLGRLVPHLVDEATVRQVLENAAADCGLVRDDGIRSVRRTITSGLRKGMQHPRDPGPQQAGGDGGAQLLDLTDRLGGPVVVLQQPAPLDLRARERLTVLLQTESAEGR